MEPQKDYDRRVGDNVFLFSTQEQFQEFWNDYLIKPGNSEIIGNTFAVIKLGWIAKVLRWLLTK